MYTSLLHATGCYPASWLILLALSPPSPLDDMPFPNSKLQPTRCNVSWIYLFYRRSTCIRPFLRPSSGALNCIYSFRYCQSILLLTATVDEMEFQGVPCHPLIYFYRRSTCFRLFLRPSSGALNCTYSFRYCQPILLQAATISTVAACSSTGWQHLKLYVQLCAPDDGRRNRLKHVKGL
jgi:hypothetical protein